MRAGAQWLFTGIAYASGVAVCARVPAQIPDQSSSVTKPEHYWRRAGQRERPSRSSLELTDTHTHISWELVSKVL